MKKIHGMIGLISMFFWQENALASTACEGIRAGLQAGYGLLDSKVKLTQTTPPSVADSSDISGRGVMGGIVIDWNTLVGNSDVLVGVEGSFNLITSKGKKSTQNVVLFANNGNDLATTVMLKRSYEFSGKVGYLFKQSALAYMKLGASLAHWKASSVSNSFPAAGATSANILGVVVGIGAEFPISERFSFGAEYSYRQYKNFVHTLNRTNGGPLLNVDVKPTSSAIMLRLTYKLSAVDFLTTAPVKERKRKRPRRPRSES